jgi:hypothetical protein
MQTRFFLLGLKEKLSQSGGLFDRASVSAARGGPAEKS